MSIVIDPASLGARVVQLRSVKYDGSLNYLWPARVLSRDAHGLLWATPAGAPFTRPTQVQPVPYDWIGRIWYARWYARWYAVDASLTPARIAGAAGVLDHYYCNIGMPGAWEGDVFQYVDLDLD